MSLIKRVLGRTDAPQSTPAAQANVPVTFTVTGITGQSAWDGDEPLISRLSGTTTSGAEALAALYANRGRPDGGMIETAGQLVAEPANPVDPDAIAVHVDGQRIGYLPSYLAAGAPSAADHAACQVQLWAAGDSGQLRVIGWVAVGDGQAVWPHDAGNPPPITTSQARAAQASAVSDMVAEALSGPDADRAARFAACVVGGRHYREYAEPIAELKRQGKLGEALELCYLAIEGAEREAKLHEWAPAPAYTEHAAIIHRKLGQHAEEIVVLTRWLAACPADQRAGSGIQTRLDKLLAKHG